jgi:ketosteroid isomerase-like protein
MKIIALVSSITLGLHCASFAQAPSDTSPERAAVLANDRAYEAAYAKGDAKTLAAFFVEDADYTTSDGRTFSGREAIEAGFAQGSRVFGGQSSRSRWTACACFRRTRLCKRERRR